MQTTTQRNIKGQFTKGNTLSYNNKGGRPRHFESVQCFQNAINGYLDSISTKDSTGRRVFYRMPTLTGLPIYANCSRETIRATVNRSAEYSDVYGVYKGVCEHELEKALYRTVGSISGVIFTLRRHYGYKTN